MASAPNHPIALNAVLRILHATAKSVDWAHGHERNVKALKSLGSYKNMQALRETTVLDEPKMGGSVGVMAWTGPGVWTDAVLR
jgi:alpha 1,6-mannosyltransferase